MTPSTDDLAAASSAVTTALADVELPTGADATLGGVVTQQQDAFSQLGLALLAAILIVYIVMVATFKSLRQPLLLLVSVPFAATGAILLQIITGVPLGVASLIGVLMLIGIVVTNAIVLVDLVNQYRDEGPLGLRGDRRGRLTAPSPDPHDRARDDLRPHADGPRHHGPRRVHLAAARDRRDRRSHLLDGADAARASDPLQPRGGGTRAPRGPEVGQMRMPQTRRPARARDRRPRTPPPAEQPALAGSGLTPAAPVKQTLPHATRRALTARRRERPAPRGRAPLDPARPRPACDEVVLPRAATARRSAQPKVASHAKISAKPMISRAARVMPPATKTTIAGTSSAATAADVTRSRLTVHGHATIRTRMPRNESIMPDAARSCRAVLTFSGTRPTIARCPPNEAMSATSTREACLRAWTTVSSRARMSAKRPAHPGGEQDEHSAGRDRAEIEDGA